MSANQTMGDRGKRSFRDFSNREQMNVMNPYGRTLALKGKDWHDPTQIDYPRVNKQVVKSIIQINKESAKIKKEFEEVEGKSPIYCLIICRTKNSIQDEKMGKS
jgi:hypothetical protein